MAKEMKWREAIEFVLGRTQEPMHYTEIAHQIVSEKLRTNVGATPASTVYAVLIEDIRKNDQTDFEKVDKGVFALTKNAKEERKQIREVTSTAPEPEVEEEEGQYGIITSFGMFWKKEFIEWVATPKILGMQQIGADPVDFHAQIGIYLLYDGREVIYVGRTTDQPLGRRLYQHTQDRLSSRWNRFSWFGLLPISESGQMKSKPDSYESKNIIPTLEAVLIEALEPRQNRKRGDDLIAVEYIQKEDPTVARKLKKQILEDALGKL